MKKLEKQKRLSLEPHSFKNRHLTVTVLELKTLDVTGKSNILSICVSLGYLWGSLPERGLMNDDINERLDERINE